MTTPLTNALKCEVYIAGVAYRVTMTAEGLTLVRKSARKAITHTWEDLLGESQPHRSVAPIEQPSPPKTTSRAVLTELATAVRTAAAAIGNADEALTAAGALPERLTTALGGDPLHGSARQADHWFIEPLLTVTEVAALLRVSTRVVRRLPIGTVPIGGEVRYLQSAVREYIKSTAQPASSRRWR
ncbi:helix-turn-helix domain-containing protein [Gemmatimonas sp.]|uniref:helix-turn-helix domain-containing protein n=1 Tax=Gemmatimonas sp. TaxID=1962908 RepID=UPI003F707E7B